MILVAVLGNIIGRVAGAIPAVPFAALTAWSLKVGAASSDGSDGCSASSPSEHTFQVEPYRQTESAWRRRYDQVSSIGTSQAPSRRWISRVILAKENVCLDLRGPEFFIKLVG